MIFIPQVLANLNNLRYTAYEFSIRFKTQPKTNTNLLMMTGE